MSKDRYHKLHTQIIGDSPNDDQAAIYQAYPKHRGYSDSHLNIARFEAVMLLALCQAAKSEIVLVLAPEAREAWVIEHFNKLADRIFARCKEASGNRVELARAYKLMFKRTYITGRLLQIDREPPQWVSFGWHAEDPLPEWLPGKLLNG